MPEAAEQRVVLVRVLGVARLLDQIATALVSPVERGALEAREKERGEDALMSGHSLPSYDAVGTIVDGGW